MNQILYQVNIQIPWYKMKQKLKMFFNKKVTITWLLCQIQKQKKAQRKYHLVTTTMVCIALFSVYVVVCSSLLHYYLYELTCSLFILMAYVYCSIGRKIQENGICSSVYFLYQLSYHHLCCIDNLSLLSTVNCFLLCDN